MDWPDRGIAELELYLEGARIDQMLTHGMGGGGHPSSFLAVFVGGVAALVKQETASDEAPAMVRREVAAWRLARTMGWTDLVSTTVLRSMVGPGSSEPAWSSLQVLWPANQPGVQIEAFPDEDLWRAAIFDAVIRASDRHAANWLSVPADPIAGQQRLKLVDHGHAFDLGRGMQTPFYDRLQGQEIPEDYQGAIEAIIPIPSNVDELLEAPEATALERRVRELRGGGTLHVSEP